MENLQDRGVWILIRIRFVLRGSGLDPNPVNIRPDPKFWNLSSESGKPMAIGCTHVLCQQHNSAGEEVDFEKNISGISRSNVLCLFVNVSHFTKHKM